MDDGMNPEWDLGPLKKYQPDDLKDEACRMVDGLEKVIARNEARNITPEMSVGLFCLAHHMNLNEDTRARLAELLRKFWKAGYERGLEEGRNE